MSNICFSVNCITSCTGIFPEWWTVTIFRSHRSTSYIDAACCYQCCVVCLSVTIVSPAKMTERIEMLFGVWIQVNPSNHVLDRDPGPPWEGAILG